MNEPASVQQHYDQHLGPIYGWMQGDFAAALQRNRDFFARLGIRPGQTGVALDLGAGNGLQAIPLAELGYQVEAVDLCSALLEELRQRAGGLAIRPVMAEVGEFLRDHSGTAEVIVCMGDTLTHLPSPDAVARLLSAAARALGPDGRLVLGFRDYATSELKGTARFIPVRSDADQVFTCFLEYDADGVTVHDLLHIRTPTGWQQRVSSYRKLRLAPAWVAGQLAATGFEDIQQSVENGLVTFVARKPSP